MEPRIPLPDGTKPDEPNQEPFGEPTATPDEAPSLDVIAEAPEDTRRGLGAATITGAQKPEGNEQKQLPPLESIPSLLALGVKGPDSMHIHKFDPSNTVWTVSSQAEDTPAGERTDEQIQLLQDIDHLKTYAPYTSDYKGVFTPDELRALVAELDVLRQRNRPDFDAIVGNIIGTVIRNEEIIPGRIVATAKFADNRPNGRSSMQMRSLRTLAGEANKALAQLLYKNVNLANYIVPIKRDPDYDPMAEKSIDLTPVFRFVAMSHGFDIYGQRSLEARQKRLETFEDNFAIITTWYESVKPIIDQLPSDVAFADSLETDTGWSHPRKAARSGVQFVIQNLIETMDKSYSGNEKYGRHKSYKLDPAAAINLQLLIAHHVENIRQKLGTGLHPSAEEISPLPLDFEF